MHPYSEALELAIMSARNARISTDKRVAQDLWKMAQEYQAEAANSARCLILATRLREWEAE